MAVCPGWGWSCAGQRLQAQQGRPHQHSSFVSGVECSWTEVLGVGEGAGSTQLCSAPHDPDPNAPVRPGWLGRPGWEAWERATEAQPSRLDRPESPVHASCPHWAKLGPVVKGSASGKGCRRQVISSHPIRSPAGVERGGERRSDPHTLTAATPTGQVWWLWLPGSSRPMAPQPRRKQHGRCQMGKVGRQLCLHRPGQTAEAPRPPRLPLPRWVSRERPHAWQTSFLLSEPLVLPADAPQVQGPCPFPALISPDHRGTGRPRRVEAQHPPPSTCVIPPKHCWGDRAQGALLPRHGGYNHAHTS